MSIQPNSSLPASAPVEAAPRRFDGRVYLYASIGAAALSLAASFALSRGWILALAALAVGLLWLVFETNTPRLVAGKEIPAWSSLPGWTGFLLLLAGAVIAGLERQPPALLVLTAAMALSAWDLSSFYLRASACADPLAHQRMERRHLRKLGLTSAIGVAVALLAASLHFSLAFAGTCLIGFFLFFALYIAMVALADTDKDHPSETMK